MCTPCSPQPGGTPPLSLKPAAQEAQSLRALFPASQAFSCQRATQRRVSSCSTPGPQACFRQSFVRSFRSLDARRSCLHIVSCSPPTKKRRCAFCWLPPPPPKCTLFLDSPAGRSPRTFCQAEVGLLVDWRVARCEGRPCSLVNERGFGTALAQFAPSPNPINPKSSVAHQDASASTRPKKEHPSPFHSNR